MDKTAEITWIAESLDDLAIMIRELHGLSDIAAQIDCVRVEFEKRALNDSLLDERVGSVLDTA